ncbi:MAG TPA: hypothetical protein VM915_00925, partial [Verrucomicrobiae bacterium]|nr:hypothetical protein [Verrucomicrobiae bacterium]
SSLQALPQQKLDAGFAQRVIQAAKRAQLGQGKAPEKLAETLHGPEVLVKSHHGKETSVELAQHEPMAWRVVVWTVAGLAALIMVVLVLPKSTEIADLPNEDQKKVVLNRGAEVSKPVAPMAKDRALPPTTATVENESAPLPKAEAFRDANRVEEKQDDTASAQKERAEQPAIDDRAKAAATAAKEIDEAPPKPTVALSRDAASNRDTGERFGGAGQGGGAGSAKAMRRMQSTNSAPARQLKELGQAIQADQVLVVRLKRSTPEAQRPSIDDVLARQSITMRGLAAGGFNATEEKAFAAADKKQAESTDEGGANAKRNIDALQKSQRKQVEEMAKAAPDADVVYVEASPEQVEAALQELRSQPGVQVAFATLDEALTEQSKFDRHENRTPGAAAPPPAPASATLGQEGAGAKPAAAVRGFAPAPSDDQALRESQKLQEAETAASKDGRESLARRRASGFAERLGAGKAKSGAGRELTREPRADKQAEKPGDAAEVGNARFADSVAQPDNGAQPDNAVKRDEDADAAPQRVRV